ncbi:CoA transferase [Virgibacillus sp. NKC19-16]|uniref:CaiB/BaiF CoA transferase family protein n=1 Tax=Virgibacillus salidurans TaxID=2831673 RepID=UPI001F2935A8|nr:CaiB/BaiF CoA-transferase family protein [Virgibacillus sp. NKC19-16]UJL45432.1 CoA transferase [Virgibacillus sp. NKC19-16]
MGAIDGIKVIEIGTAINGPYCGQILADHGAEVIKIEAKDDIGHKRTPIYKGLSLHYTSVNRNKKSIALDLKSEEGRDVLYRLIEESDVLLTNYAAGVPERLGFGYDKVSQINPQIVMTHITGFGLTGSFRNKKAFDPIIQGMSGILHLTGEPDGSPSTIGVYLADHFTPLQAALGTLMALYSRTITGKGQLIDVSMLDSMVSTHAFNFSDTTLNKVSHKRTGSRISYTFSGIFPTKDGYVVIAPLSDEMWDGFCEAIDRYDWKTEHSKYWDMNKRLDDFDILEEGFVKWSIQYSTEEVIRILDGVGVPCGPVSTIEEVIDSPITKERDMILPLKIPGYEEIMVPGVPIKFNETPHRAVSPPPFLSQNANEILSSLGYSEEDISRMIDEGAVVRYEDKEVGK